MDRTKRDAITSILGLGSDNDDGHFRLTEGENFKVQDGSESSHEQMQRLCLQINAELDRRGVKLGDLSRAEFLKLIEGLEVEPWN